MGQAVGPVDVSRETYERLREFEALVQKWTKSINLVAKSNMSEVWERHIVDSAQVWPIGDVPGDHWVDLGSGGGFPGIVVSIIDLEKRAGRRMTLVESDQRKTTFLRTAIRELGLNAEAISKRIDDVASLEASVLSARALAALPELLPFAARHLAKDGRAIFPKGRQAKNEIEAARASWDFDLEQHPSVTDAEATILSIERLKRAEL